MWDTFKYVRYIQIKKIQKSDKLTLGLSEKRWENNTQMGEEVTTLYFM